MHHDADEQDDKAGDDAEDEDDTGLPGREIGALDEGVWLRDCGHFILVLVVGILSVSEQQKASRLEGR